LHLQQKEGEKNLISKYHFLFLRRIYDECKPTRRLRRSRPGGRVVSGRWSKKFLLGGRERKVPRGEGRAYLPGAPPCRRVERSSAGRHLPRRKSDGLAVNRPKFALTLFLRGGPGLPCTGDALQSRRPLLACRGGAWLSCFRRGGGQHHSIKTTTRR